MAVKLLLAILVGVVVACEVCSRVVVPAVLLPRLAVRLHQLAALQRRYAASQLRLLVRQHQYAASQLRFAAILAQSQLAAAYLADGKPAALLDAHAAQLQQHPAVDAHQLLHLPAAATDRSQICEERLIDNRSTFTNEIDSRRLSC